MRQSKKKEKEEVSANSVQLEKTNSASGSTGPRSESGKRRSSRNAIKFGIFSQVTLLPHESREQYETLLTGLRASFNPQGELEELLVEKLASIVWRQRRLLVAEGAEIRRGVELFERDHRNEVVQEAVDVRTLAVENCVEIEPGAIWATANPVVLEQCLEMLEQVQSLVKEDGLDSEGVAERLESLYGETVHLRETPRDDYLRLVETAKLSRTEGKNWKTPEECTEIFLNLLSIEIQGLKKYGEECASLESDRLEIEVIRRNVPEARDLDRLVKYEANLDRLFDRTFSRLERVQRLRKGEPVPPTLKVEIDS